MTLQEGETTGALADRVVAYDEDWAIALHAPYLDHVGSRSKDLFRRHTLQPGESRTFEAWLQVAPRGDLAPVLAAEIERTHVASGVVHGAVRSRDGTPVDEPVIVDRRGKARPTPGASVATASTKFGCRPATTSCMPPPRVIRRASRCRVHVAAGAATATIFATSSRPGRSSSR